MVFGPEGTWPRFLRPGKGYMATVVTAESASDGRYRVQDFWIGHRDFEVFREEFSEGFKQFEREIAAELVDKEQFVGAYYEADGDDLVPA
jgi:hypothetical protein